jgi:formylglycine-generating enzyme required for sulfatase activity
MRARSPCSRHGTVSARSLRRSALVLVGLAALFVAPPPSAAVTIDWVTIGNPGNTADTPSTNCIGAGCGSVPYAYRISMYEVTNAQYAEFLNAKAASDPRQLYHTNMGLDATYGGITRSGASGSYSYSVKAGFADEPVNFVTFYDSLRFVNWLHNGQGSGDTETGAYTLLGGTTYPSNWATVLRNPGATIVLPSENEWYKAAYYDPISAGYFDYPTGTDTGIGCVAPGSDTGNSANCLSDGFTDVGAYALSDSPYGTYDQGGNALEWNETIGSENARGLRGGAFLYDAIDLAASAPGIGSPVGEGFEIGFRVASPIPEPGTGLLVMTGLAALATRRRRRAPAR